MKSTTYAGIDYGNLKEINSQNGFRYGVISQHSISPDALDDIWRNGKDMAWEAALEAEIEAAKERARQNAAGNAEDAEEIDEDQISQDLADNWQSDNGLSDYLYERDGYKVTGCLQNDLFVLQSPFYTYAQFCSPCVPGAGNLDSYFSPANPIAECDAKAMLFQEEAKDNGFPRVFCLGHDWFESGRAPYMVFDLKTGKEVKPTQ